MNLAPGVRLGPYEIVAPIGAGGMGEVYRARDTRLDRTVAIKVLPSALAQSAQLRQRFEREAKAISALAHPNICTLHDVGSHDGIEFLVMEHLEGENLADRLSRGPLPIDDALRFAMQIADALDKAHRRGIIHRDLKPGNIMITRAGAKLLDFGLARSIDTEAVSADSATIAHKPITEEGTIVGTVQYMAPEQLESRPADARTDIFAFGAVLYEMLTGKRAFGGKSRASVIASILGAEPQPVSATQPTTPAALERVIRICLEKDPDDRWQSAHDVRLELEGLSLASPTAKTKARASYAGWIAAALIAAIAIAWLVVDRARHTPPARLQFEIAPLPDAPFNTADAPAIVSPDGTRLAVGVDEGAGARRIRVRRLDSTSFETLRGTEDAADLFWSSNGRQLGFFRNGSLHRIDIATSAITTICPAGYGMGGTWSGDTILFAPTVLGPIMRIPASGGTPTPVTKLDASRRETGHARPHFLPDGKRFLFLAQSVTEAMSAVYVGSLEDGSVRRILDIATAPVYADPGRLLYVHDGTLYSQPFDLSEAKTAGPAVVVARNVGYNPQYQLPAFSIGGNVLAYHTGTSSTFGPIARIDLAGRVTPMPMRGANLDISRDGTRLAAMNAANEQRNADIWMYDLRRGMSSRVTFDPAIEVGPVWSPDGRRIAYQLISDAGSTLRIASSSGGASEEILSQTNDIEPVAWSPDGKTLIGESVAPTTLLDLVFIDLATRRITPFANGPFDESSGRFSRGGRWIAYESDETGMIEIYLQPFPPDGTRVQVTSGGASDPRWTDDDRLFYVRRDRRLTSVSVTTGANGIELGVPQTHLRLDGVDYVMMPDGSAVIAALTDSARSQPIVVMTNWNRR